MSELKVVKQSEVIWGHWFSDVIWGNWFTEYYLKSEADKVIAEKDEELRHSNYKRCLAMAKICENKLGTVVKPVWWDKWRRRWLELAEVYRDRR